MFSMNSSATEAPEAKAKVSEPEVQFRTVRVPEAEPAEPKRKALAVPLVPKSRVASA